MAFTPDAAVDYLRRARKQGRLAHAYLISGANGSGKARVAAQIAADLNDANADDVLAGKVADVIITEPASRSRRIVVEQIRNLERSLQLQTNPARRKIGIMRDADRMQPQAANAFLKTLEEPPANSLLLLLTAMPEALPDTIVSRCLSVPLLLPVDVQRTAAETELLDLLARSDEHSVGGAYRIAQSIQRLLQAMRDEVKSEHAALLKSEEQRYRNTTDGAWLEEREDYFKSLTESVYRERRSRLIETLFDWWAAALRAKATGEKAELAGYERAVSDAAAKHEAKAILRKLRRLEEMRDQLNTTAQEALVLEVACLRVFG
ncbi:MAG: hypothetical protein M3R59_10520 [Verrucomicrobiota bacterium]|nr:hypothetical protein [Verrucomicrobiota bacterium]